LLNVVDQRDSFAADHSARVAALARRIAEEMGLEALLVETAELAGQLLNLGKILVPPELLRRAGGLNDDELRLVRESLHASADLVAGVEFDGPVVATLRQAAEAWDGSGPLGLKGQDILPTARVVAVANAFVALISARAHRPGLDIDGALDRLLAASGRRFDRRVVAALVGEIENRGGRARWTAAA
jgi:HD-GYP domain-containing protein (c-di-GMP phosphodiesterase class II)